MLLNILAVAAGSAAGGVLRYLVAYISRGYPGQFPYWTLLVNVVGGFIIGLAALLLSDSERGRLLLMTGFCGGFTTFSAFSLETIALMERGQTVLAMSNIALNVLLSIGACMAGSAVGEKVLNGA